MQSSNLNAESQTVFPQQSNDGLIGPFGAAQKPIYPVYVPVGPQQQAMLPLIMLPANFTPIDPVVPQKAGEIPTWFKSAKT